MQSCRHGFFALAKRPLNGRSCFPTISSSLPCSFSTRASKPSSSWGRTSFLRNAKARDTNTSKPKIPKTTSLEDASQQIRQFWRTSAAVAAGATVVALIFTYSTQDSLHEIQHQTWEQKQQQVHGTSSSTAQDANNSNAVSAPILDAKQQRLYRPLRVKVQKTLQEYLSIVADDEKEDSLQRLVVLQEMPLEQREAVALQEFEAIDTDEAAQAMSVRNRKLLRLHLVHQQTLLQLLTCETKGNNSSSNNISLEQQNACSQAVGRALSNVELEVAKQQAQLELQLMRARVAKKSGIGPI